MRKKIKMAKQTKLKEKEFIINCEDLMGQHLQILYKGKPLNTVQIAKLRIITDKIITDKGESYDEFIEDYKLQNGKNKKNNIDSE